MTTDRELLELAAKAAGHQIMGWITQCGVDVAMLSDGSFWQPLLKNSLTDCMGDALRLAVKLELDVHNRNGKAHSGREDIIWCTEEWLPNGGAYAANHRAIVRAAAEIGRAMP